MLVTPAKLAANRRNAQLAGRPPGRLEDTTMYAKAFKAYVAKKVEEHKEALVASMIVKAIDGDVTAFNALMDRAHGKPAQAVEMSGKDGNPIVFMPLELIQKHALQVAANVVNDDKNTPVVQVIGTDNKAK